MAILPTYTKGYQITFSEVDFKHFLKVSNLFNYFQDTASLTIDSLGLGVDSFKENKGFAWILTRIRLEIIRMPRYDEEITVTAWYQDHKKWDFQFDFLVLDSEGRKLAGAVTTWMMLDIATREIRTSDQLGKIVVPMKTEGALETKPGKLKARNELDLAYKRFVGYSDIDLNGHLNNSRFLDIALDSLGPDIHRNYDVMAVEVNYLGEAFMGDELHIYAEKSCQDECRVYIEVHNDKDGKVVFKSQLELVERPAE